MRQALRWRFRDHPDVETAWGSFAREASAAGATRVSLYSDGKYRVGEMHGQSGPPPELPLPSELEKVRVDGPWLHDVVVRASQPEGARDKLLPVVETERLRLRAIRHADAPSLHRALSDDETMRYWSRGPLESLEETRGYVSWNVEADESLCWAITELGRLEEALGWFIIRPRGPRVGEIGYILVPSGRGRGLAREASQALVEHPLGGRSFRRLIADIDPDNLPSIQLVERLGFQKEAHLRGEWETHLGIRDSLIYGRVWD